MEKKKNQITNVYKLFLLVMKRHAEAKEKHLCKETSYVSYSMLCFTLLKAMLLLDTTYLQMTPANP